MIPRLSNTPTPDPLRWSRVHLEGDKRAPQGMIKPPSLLARLAGRLG